LSEELQTLSSIIEKYVDVLRTIFSDKTIILLFDISIVIIVGVIIVKTINVILKRMVRKDVISQTVYEKLYNIVSIAIYAVILIILLSLLTGSEIMIYTLLGLIFLLLVSGYDVLANLIAYYAIILSKNIMVGSTITLDNITGKVREIKPLYIEIKGDTGDIIRIPNREIFKRHFLVHGTSYKVSVIVRLRNIASIEDAENMLKTVLQKFKDAVIASKPEIDVIKVSKESIEFMITVYIASPEKINYVKTELSKILFENIKDNVEILASPNT